MASFIRRKGNVVFRSQTLAAFYSKLHRSNCTLAEGVMDKCSSARSVIDEDINSVDTSKWKKLKLSDAGIRYSMIPEPSLNVLRLLRRQGYDAYLVGGCVRDLILHRVPKDYDVITTANLKQIRRLFHRAQVIGKRFPICHVWMKGSLLEVSSFDTVAHSDSEHENDSLKSEEGIGAPQNAEATKNSSLSKIYSGLDVKDHNRWKNSLQRDFTINSLFLDPFDYKVYDYANGMEDLKDLKLRTLIPAHLSFTEDCARILRGIRIAARLGLSLSKDVETAIPEFVSPVADLGQFRLLMEMNYMLAYGAAAPSILLLMKFKLLHVLLPFQAAYLDQVSKTSLTSSLIVRLFSNMDRLVSCDRPADSRLWIAVLAFHTALLRNPQEPIVVCAFASLLYHGNWTEAVKFAREHENSVPGFAHVGISPRKRSDEDLAKAVSKFAYQFKDNQYVLTEMEALQEALYVYPNFKCKRVVFIPKKKASEVAEVLARLSNVESYESKKEGFSIDYLSLKRGNPFEIKFVLGKIILDTIAEGSEQLNSVTEKQSMRNKMVPATVKENMDDLVFSKPSKDDDNENKNTQETMVCRDSILSVQAKNQVQPVAQKLKRRRSKEAPVSEAPKPEISKRSKSEAQEIVGSPSGPSRNQHQSVLEKSSMHGEEAPVTEPPKPKTSKYRSRETRKGKCNDMPVKETRDANGSFVSDKSMSELVKALEKSSSQETPKEESDPLSSEKTNNQDQSVAQKLKKRRSKEAAVSEAPKSKISKRSKSKTKGTVGSLSGQSRNQHQSAQAPVTEPPKPKTSKNRSRETRKVKCNDMPAKETRDANGSFVSDKSMRELVKVLEKSSPQESTKEESDPLSSEKTKHQDQPVAQKLRKQRSKEAAVSEAPKSKISKRSKSKAKETVGSLSGQSRNQHQSAQAPVTEPPKPKTSKNSSKGTRKVKCNDMPIKETEDANGSFVCGKSMSLLVKVFEKWSPQESVKKESNSLPSEKTKRPRTLSSLFK